MSSVYVSEPPTKGKVVVKTSMGPLDIELWPKEAPKASRNFLQLCLEGYFDNTIFHRIIKSFLVQTGDPSGSGTGGESIYGGVFADEFHSRLRFNHRGLVACANAGSPHSNASQFFITLDRCDWLDRKNTIFGKVTGDSIYNLLRLGELETDKNDRPLAPPKILSVEVLWNPFDDIVPRKLKEHPIKGNETDRCIKEQTMPAIKKLSVLSFGEEVEEEEKNVEVTTKEKIKSIHEVLNDPRFLKEESKVDDETKAQDSEIEVKKGVHLSVREALSSKNSNFNVDQESELSDGFNDDNESQFDAHMRAQILKKRKEMGDVSTSKKLSGERAIPRDNRIPPSRSDDDKKEASHIEKLSLKKKGIGSEAKADLLAKSDADLQLLSSSERERHLMKQRKRRIGSHEDDTLARLQKFKSSFATQLSTPGSGDSKENDDDDSGWLVNSLKFASESNEKDAMARKDDPNEYVVFDPLLEKGKEKFNKMQAKLKRREREWAGRSLT